MTKKGNQKQRILIIEDGSVDVDSLQAYIDANDLQIYILVYRQGGTPPRWLGE